MKKETIKQAVAPYMAELTKMADRIYDLAEPGLEEVRSSAILTDYLEKKGGSIDPLTAQAYEYFKKVKGERDELKGNGETGISGSQR